MSKSSSNPTPFVVPLDGSASVSTLDAERYHREVTRPHRWIPLRSWRLIGRRLFVEIFNRSLMDRGALLSFYTLFTGIPTLLAFYSIATLLLAQNSNKVRELSEDFINQNIPENYAEEARKVIDILLGNTQQSVITLVISVAIALFSSSAYVRAFSRSANALYGRHEGRGILRTWTIMWGLTIAIVAGLALILIAFFLQAEFLTPILNSIAQPLHLNRLSDFFLGTFLPVWKYVRWPVIFGLSIALIALLYTIAPNVQYGKMRWLTVGSTFALIAVSLVGLGVRVYVNNFLHIGMYGALGGLIGGFFGLLISNTILLLGLKLDAEITRVRELQAGLHSEALILAPPRCSKGAEGNNHIDARLRKKAAEFRQDNHPDAAVTAEQPAANGERR
ncbi:YihY/virulence factor BrkB family protein [Corynebacterium gerontici]|uniref:Ribonuclease BN-like family protein n=1 Tax=Corynebacterium gerontici TaxID=2079234 RepID=A0A3G6J1E6_9CORY|nr:YihY/virulence factor BrkB family protein [Corynebacterium gerontici]AZA10778.1 Ribonuclease BN-like family protein [Corynebacterium gerontici]